MGREPPPYTVKEYRLSLDVDYETLDFSGKVAVDLEGVEGDVLLNAVELEIDSAHAGGEALVVEPVPEEEGIRLRPKGSAPTVEVEFHGHASERALQGLYKSRLGAYYMLTTNLEPVAARRVFPCIDRPDRKAPIAFDLTVGVEDDVVANTPIVEQKTRGSRKRLTFLPTPPMATYLFHFGVGPFEVLKGRASRVRLGVLAPVDRSAAGAFALEKAAAILPAFEAYFGIPYPLPKLDLIDVPEIGPGAMENWGAITFAERLLLVDQNTSSRLRRLALSTIAHEIAHQWFGNLVTMSWWTDIWLNESFATFMDAKILEQLYPEAQSIPDFLLTWISPALHGDSLPGTHAVELTIERPEQIPEIFDSISYGKGAGVLRMTEAYIGAEGFRSGVRSYLEKFRFGNASSADLWAALETSSGQPLVPMLRAWIDRPGHPVVFASLHGEQLVVEQQRFQIGDAARPEELWPIPLAYRVNGKSHRLLFSTAREEIAVGPVRSLHLNEGAVGFYHVRYDDALYNRLLVDWDALPVEEQWTVVFDLYSFLLSGAIDLNLYLRFLSRAAAGPPSHAAFELARQYAGLDVHDEPPALAFVLPRHPVYQASVATLLDSQLGRIGLEPKGSDSDAVRALRTTLARGLLWNRPEGARALADRFASFDTVEADLRLPVAWAYARTGGSAEHAAILERLQQAEDDTTVGQMASALTCFQDPECLRATVDLLSTGVIWRNHLARTIIALARNPSARDLTWEWMMAHGPAAMQDLAGTGHGGWILSEALPYVGLGREDEVEAGFADHPWPESAGGLRKGLDGLRMTSALVRRLS